jgi:N-acyl-D-aspartate/D-glutamate deacylase
MLSFLSFDPPSSILDSRTCSIVTRIPREEYQMHDIGRSVFVTLTLVVVLSYPSPTLGQTMTSEPHDVLIRGGVVVDGTGSPGVPADVAIVGDRIAAIGPDLGAARDTIDAVGLVVAPGFIDMLGHSEFRLLADGRAISKIFQGVTTEITGEVSSVAPVSEATKAERASEISPWDIEIDWEDLNGYFERLERQGTAINLGTWVGLSTLRVWGVGEEDRPATPAEMDSMKAALARAMEQGAFGLSSGLIYAPGRFASTDEIVELARVVADAGGFYATHMRSEGARLFEAIDEAIAIGERSGAPVLIHHLKASGKSNWGKMAGAIERIAAARARGVDVMASVYPYVASSTGLDQVLPDWVSVGGTEATLARLADPALRDSIEAELSGRTQSGDWTLGTSAGGPSGIQISDIVTDSLVRYEGMRLDAIAAERGQSAAEAAIDLLVADSLRTSAIYFSMSEDDLVLALGQPWVMIGGDAGIRALDGPLSTDQPHPRAFGTFPRVLCRYSREMEVFPLEEAVRRMTSLPAARAGLAERGVLEAGRFADVVAFDPATVCDRATFEEPKRLAIGVEHVIVNGVPVLRGGEPTGELPGRGLRFSED